MERGSGPAPSPSPSSEPALDAAALEAWATDGFVRVDGFAPPEVGAAMLDRVVAIARAAAGGDDVAPAFVMPEQQPDLGERPNPEDLVSKVFRLHRDPVFAAFATDPAVTGPVARLLGTDDVDCFLSQFIFKNPGAWGQPWHQDSYYFPFEPARPVVGAWLAVSAATRRNGCLHVVAGSHTRPVLEHGPARREHANYGYVEIPDVDEATSTPVLMAPGDLLLFDSHLIHRSTDNVDVAPRAAMVFHFAPAGTVDRTEERLGYTINDWVPVRRSADRLPAGS